MIVTERLYNRIRNMTERIAQLEGELAASEKQYNELKAERDRYKADNKEVEKLLIEVYRLLTAHCHDFPQGFALRHKIEVTIKKSMEALIGGLIDNIDTHKGDSAQLHIDQERLAKLLAFVKKIAMQNNSMCAPTLVDEAMAVLKDG